MVCASSRASSHNANHEGKVLRRSRIYQAKKQGPTMADGQTKNPLGLPRETAPCTMSAMNPCLNGCSPVHGLASDHEKHVRYEPLARASEWLMLLSLDDRLNDVPN